MIVTASQLTTCNSAMSSSFTTRMQTVEAATPFQTREVDSLSSYIRENQVNSHILKKNCFLDFPRLEFFRCKRGRKIVKIGRKEKGEESKEKGRVEGWEGEKGKERLGEKEREKGGERWGEEGK